MGNRGGRDYSHGFFKTFPCARTFLRTCVCKTRFSPCNMLLIGPLNILVVVVCMMVIGTSQNPGSCTSTLAGYFVPNQPSTFKGQMVHS